MNKGLIILTTIAVAIIIMMMIAIYQKKKKNPPAADAATDENVVSRSYKKIIFLFSGIATVAFLIWYFLEEILEKLGIASGAISSISIDAVFVYAAWLVAAIILFFFFRWLFKNQMGLGKKVTLMIASNVIMWIVAHGAMYFAWHQEVMRLWEYSQNNILLIEALVIIVYIAGFVWGLTGPNGTIKKGKNRVFRWFHYVTAGVLIFAIYTIAQDIDHGKDNEAVKSLIIKYTTSVIFPGVIDSVTTPPQVNPSVWNKIPYVKKNGKTTLSSTKKNGVTLPAGHYLFEIQTGTVEWSYDNSSKTWEGIKNGQELKLTSKAYLYAKDGTAQFRVQKQ